MPVPSWSFVPSLSQINHLSLPTSPWSKSFSLSPPGVVLTALYIFSHPLRLPQLPRIFHFTSGCFPQTWPCHCPILKFLSDLQSIISGKTPNPPICKASSLIFYDPPAPLVCTSATLTLSQVLPHYLILIWHFMCSWSTHLARGSNYVKYLSSSSIINLSLPVLEN